MVELVAGGGSVGQVGGGGYGGDGGCCLGKCWR